MTPIVPWPVRLCAACVILCATTARAATLTNGALTVNIDDGNGAIINATLDVEYFAAGTYVSDWGLQNDADTGTFRRNTAGGLVEIAVSNPSLATYTGTYTAGGADISFERRYSLFAGHNVLLIDSEFVNNGSATTLSYFDTFDPDQGVDRGSSYSTYNDVFDLGGFDVGRARIDDGGFTDTVVVGSPDPEAVVASGSPFSINSGDLLNSFLTAPFDGDDTFGDAGTHVAFRRSLSPGESYSFRSTVAFGLSPAAAQNGFLAAVPEPSTIVLATLAAAALAVCSLRRRGNHKVCQNFKGARS